MRAAFRFRRIFAADISVLSHRAAGSEGRSWWAALGGAAALSSTAMLASDDTEAYSWGWAQYGQLGHGEEHDLSEPTRIKFLSGAKVRQLTSMGCATSTGAVNTEGEVFTFGCGNDSRLGHGHADRAIEAPNQGIPRMVDFIDEPIEQLAVGEYHMVARSREGRLWSWGKPRAGQLGHDNERKGFPNCVQGLEGVRIVDVACGRQHSVAVSEDGRVFSWGHGGDGALGLGSRNNEHRPVLIKDLEGVRIQQVTCGRDHTLFLSDDGRVFAAGLDSSGQLGQGFERRYQRTPVVIRPLSGKKVVQVAAGESHSVAVTESGDVYTFGLNSHGQLGHGDRTDVGIPRLMDAMKGIPVVAAAAGGAHTLLLTKDNRVFACGRGRNGQLGRGSALESIAAYRTTPVEVESLRDKSVLSVAAGSDHSLALVQGE